MRWITLGCIAAFAVYQFARGPNWLFGLIVIVFLAFRVIDDVSDWNEEAEDRDYALVMAEINASKPEETKD
jgi:hypothetical protein